MARGFEAIRNNFYEKAYHYLFYKFYRFFECVSLDSWSDFKALVMMSGFDLFLLLSIDIYTKVFTKKAIILDLPKSVLIIIALVVAMLNYFLFIHHDKWKKMIVEFDRLPKRTNRIGGWVVCGVILFVVANLIFSFYLMSQINWSQYR